MLTTELQIAGSISAGVLFFKAFCSRVNRNIMKNKIIHLVAKGEINKAIEQVELFLAELKDEYFEWIALKSRYNELTKT